MSDVSIALKDWDGREFIAKGKKVSGRSSFEIGIKIANQAKALCPVDLGRLRGSITVQGRGVGTAPTSGEVQAGDVISFQGKADEVVVGTNVNYAEYVEYGTVRSRAQPYMRPAVELAKGNALQVVMKNGRTEFKKWLK